jgi:hypothetical protein
MQCGGVVPYGYKSSTWFEDEVARVWGRSGKDMAESASLSWQDERALAVAGSEVSPAISIIVEIDTSVNSGLRGPPTCIGLKRRVEPMPEQAKDTQKPLLILRVFGGYIELRVARLKITYRKLLILAVVILAIVTGANLSVVLDWLANLVALFA